MQTMAESRPVLWIRLAAPAAARGTPVITRSGGLRAGQRLHVSDGVRGVLLYRPWRMGSHARCPGRTRIGARPAAARPCGLLARAQYVYGPLSSHAAGSIITTPRARCLAWTMAATGSEGHLSGGLRPDRAPEGVAQAAGLLAVGRDDADGHTRRRRRARRPAARRRHQH